MQRMESHHRPSGYEPNEILLLYSAINLVRDQGFEPWNAGIKIQCLDQLGESPTIWYSVPDSNPVYRKVPGLQPGAVANATHSPYFGTPTGNRTPIAGMKTRIPNR